MSRTWIVALAATSLLALSACGGSSAGLASDLDAAQSAASSGRYEHISVEWPYDEFDAPAGEVCDFHLIVGGDGGQKGGRFYDAEGRRVRAFWEITENNTFQNVDTGDTIHETINYSLHRDFVHGLTMVAGLNYQTRDEDGAIVILSAGRMVEAYDPETDSFVFIFDTPHMIVGFEAWALNICTALGGAPAI